MLSRPLFPNVHEGSPLHACILSFVGRYKVCTASSISRMLHRETPGAGEDLYRQVECALRQLVANGQLSQLEGDSPLASHVYFLPDHVLKPTDIARLWWCCLDIEVRPLVTYSELKRLYAAEGIKPPFHNYSHAIVEYEGGPAICRIYQCSATSRKNIREQIRRHLTTNAKSFGHWIDEGSYRLAVLVTSPAKQKMVEALVAEPYRDSPPLSDLAGITVSVVPDEQTFAAMHAEYLVRESDE